MSDAIATTMTMTTIESPSHINIFLGMGGIKEFLAYGFSLENISYLYGVKAT